ncbi:hypothetical protein [Coleofasciculus sp. E1-EBD-02]|jgi:hypothetical protein|uniref:hypothetical protein n=1 Tax=Coleofasciculus sp. E1-EBD-02 TaxID=3068481 RepID=UPI0033033D03
MKTTNTSTIPMTANQPDVLPANSRTLLVNGGVTILAIVALTYFTKTLIESIAKLLALKHPPQ